MKNTRNYETHPPTPEEVMKNIRHWYQDPPPNGCVSQHLHVAADFIEKVDTLTSTDLTTARDDDYGAGWNAALAVLRQRLGLKEK